MPQYPDLRSIMQSVSGTEHYFISDEDKSTVIKYYGLVSRTGAWVIMKNDTTASSYRYISGKSGYTTKWTNRASLTYKYIYELP